MTNQKDPEEREKVEMAKIDSFEPAHDAVVGQGVCVDSNQLLRRLNNRQIQLIAIGKFSRNKIQFAFG